MARAAAVPSSFVGGSDFQRFPSRRHPIFSHHGDFGVRNRKAGRKGEQRGLALVVRAVAAGKDRREGRQEEHNKPSVAVVDVSRLCADEEMTPSSPEVLQIAEAAQSHGFFQVVGHGIDPDLVHSMAERQRWFFGLPKDVKQRIKRTPSNSRGWFDDEFTKQKLDWKEGLDIGVEGKTDVIDGTNQWLLSSGPGSTGLDAEAEAFKAVTLEYFEAMTGLSKDLTRLLAIGLGMPSAFWEEDFAEHTSFLRLNFYPRCTDPSQHLGISPHKDAGFLTVLAQHDIAGLQVYYGKGDGLDRNDESWMTVDPVPGAFVINVGDMFQVASNGRYQAPLHRVLANRESVRFSAPFFYNPSHSCSFEPVSGCVSGEQPARYRPVNWGEFRRRRIEGDMADVGAEVQISDYLL